MLATTILVTVTTSGTPVRITTNQAISAQGIFIKPFSGNTDGTICYFGLSGLDKNTGDRLIADFQAPSDSFAKECANGVNGLTPADYWVDASADAQKLLFTYWVA